jgi:hypothetical protein
MSDEDSLSCRPLYRSRSLPQLHTLGSYSEPLRRGAGGGTRLVAAEVRQLLTLKQHYYPAGGWGWVGRARGAGLGRVADALDLVALVALLPLAVVAAGLA